MPLGISGACLEPCKHSIAATETNYGSFLKRFEEKRQLNGCM